MHLLRMTGRMVTTMPKSKTVAAFRFRPFSRRQRKVLNWWCDESPYKDKDGIIADGAIRSGKTVCMALSFIMWAMSSFNNEQFGMAGKTISSFRRNVMNPLLRMLKGRGYDSEYSRSDNVLTVTKNGISNEFFIFGGKDEASQDLVQGITCAGFFFDEVALMPESFVNQATGRCSVDGSKLWFNCNPSGPLHWFKVDWLDKAKDLNLLHLHFTMDDNLTLSDRIKERYRRMYSGVFYDRFILGRWTVADGLVYDMFDREKHVLPITEIAPKLGRLCYVSCDYGTQNATVFKMWCKGTDGLWYCIREYYYSGRDARKQKTDEEYADDMVEFADDAKPRAIIVDPSAASFIEALRRRGLPVIKAKNDVIDGIREMSRLLTTERIKYADCCTHTFDEFAAYSWDKKAAERGEDAPIKTMDHCMDADRYFIHTILEGARARIGKKGIL